MILSSRKPEPTCTYREELIEAIIGSLIECQKVLADSEIRDQTGIFQAPVPMYVLEIRDVLEIRRTMNAIADVLRKHAL